MIPVCDRVKFSELEGREKELAKGMVEMFIELGPFTTFGTITVAPRHDRCSVSAMTMERLMLKELRRRRFKGMEFGYFVEKNKRRMGTHGHFVTANEPSELRWAGKDGNSVGEYMIEKYGRFQTAGVKCKTIFGLAAYLAKYCSKEHADGHWGFVNFEKRDLVLKNKPEKMRPMGDRCQAPAVAADVILKWKKDQAAWNWQKGVGRKIRQHSGTRENGRLNVRTREVKEAGEKFGHFEQTMVYNNAK
jgi:hypothetical protein